MNGPPKLRQWRTRIRFSQIQAAKHLGLNRSLYSLYETGTRCPKLKNAAKIERGTSGEVAVRDWQ